MTKKIKQKYYCIKCKKEMKIVYEKIDIFEEGLNRKIRPYWNETNELVCECGYRGSEFLQSCNSLFEDVVLTKSNGIPHDYTQGDYVWGIPARITKVGKEIFVELVRDHPWVKDWEKNKGEKNE